MSTPVIAYRFDPTKTINYIGDDAEGYPAGGPVVFNAVQTASISGYDLDALELSSNGKVVFTTDGDQKALEVSGLGLADPAVIDTTVLDTGAKNLQLTSKTTSFASSQISFNADTLYHAYISVADAADPTFHHVATKDKMILGTGVLGADYETVSGSFLKTTADSFELGHDTASIQSVSGAEARIRYNAAGAHEFFVGEDAATQADKTGAIEILADKVIIRKDVDLVGTLNSIDTNSTTLSVEDQILRLAYTDDPATAHRDSLLDFSKSGVVIETVPGSYADDGTYMSKFLAPDNSKLFVDDDAQTIDITKAKDSGLFTKEVAFYLNSGAKSAGQVSEQSRLTEPYWNVSGGALQLSHVVPAGDGKVKKFALGFRITDNGNMEMCRLTKHLAWDDAQATFVPDTSATDSAAVVARYISSAA